MDSRHAPTSTPNDDESNSPSSRDDRFRGLCAIVDQALLCSGRDRPETDEYLSIVASWGRILEDVPSQFLAESYVRAMRARHRPGLLTPNEIHGAWIELRAELRRQQAEAESQKYLNPVPVSDGRRFLLAGLEAARRMRGIPTPAGTPPSDEADVQAALRAIAERVDAKERDRLEAMRSAPAEVRAGYRTPGPDTLDRLRAASDRRGGEFRSAADAAKEG